MNTKIRGVNHLTFPVYDVEESFHFYRDLLGLTPLVKWERGAYFLAGEIWFCLSLAKNDVKLLVEDYRHLSFSVEQNHFESLKKSLIDFGVESWSENQSEGDSFYFRDPNGHNLEIHVGDWRTRIEDLKKNPWEGTIEFFLILTTAISWPELPQSPLSRTF